MSDHWRADHLPTGALRCVPSWRATEAAAVAHADALIRAGVERVVVWEEGEA